MAGITVKRIFRLLMLPDPQMVWINGRDIISDAACLLPQLHTGNLALLVLSMPADGRAGQPDHHPVQKILFTVWRSSVFVLWFRLCLHHLHRLAV